MTAAAREPGAAVEAALPTITDIMASLCSGVTVIATHADGLDVGATASSVTVLSDEPAMMLVCLTRASAVATAVAERGAFSINVLREDHGPLAMRFAGRRQDRFSGVLLDRTADGLPMLAESLSSLVCDVVASHSAGRHEVFFAQVRKGHGREGTPLAYYGGKFARLELAEDQTAYDAARNAVLEGVLPRETEFPIELAADAVGLPHGAVFQAMRRLAHEGLVERRGADRYVVTRSTDEVIADLCRARCDIEIGVVHGLSLPLASDKLDRLRTLHADLQAQERDGRVGDVQNWLRADSRFHEALVGLSGSELLVRSFRSLNVPAWDVERLGDPATAPVLLGDHERLLEALSRGDAHESAHTIRAHSCRLQPTHHDKTGETA
jgi:4-nitrophenol 2-monooxygenase / 4-nitrocatechol 4-monooxygenase, reductase component